MFLVSKNYLHPAPSAGVWFAWQGSALHPSGLWPRSLKARMQAEIVNIEKPPKRRGGRPKKAPAELRSKRLNVRFTEAEYNELCEKAAAANLAPTDFAHAELVNARMPKSVPLANREIYGKLIPLTSNLNQLVKMGQSGGHVAVDLMALRELQVEVIRLRKSLIGA